MTDYFALFDEPRRPWLELEKLKAAFHARTLQAHPDAQPSSAASVTAEADFAEINEAYQVLQDPKRRLQHLLLLEGAAPSTNSAAVPEELAELFPMVAELTQQAERLAQRTADTTNALSRSLLRAEQMQVAQRLTGTLQQLQLLREDAETRLQQIAQAWSSGNDEQTAALQELYLRFSYLQRWIAELRERSLVLS